MSVTVRTFPEREESSSSFSSDDDPPTIDGLQPSKATMDRSLAAKMYIEQYYTNKKQQAKERGDRYAQSPPLLLHSLPIAWIGVLLNLLFSCCNWKESKIYHYFCMFIP